MTKNFIRILTLAESLSDAPARGFTKSEIVARAGFPASTVYRLLNEMEQAGFIYTTDEGRLLPNFTFERRIGTGAVHPERLRHTCALISDELGSASEIILHRGHNLLWHITSEHPLQPIKLRAHPGFVRSTYELDAISRVALSECGLTTIEGSWDLSGFHDVGPHGPKLSWDEVKRRIQGASRGTVQYDMRGNAKGIRRFAVAIKGAAGEFVCILTVAEAATPVHDETRHIMRIRDTLTRAKAALESAGTTIESYAKTAG